VDGRRQRAGLEQTLDERELLAHLLDRLVLDVDQVLEAVVLDELEIPFEAGRRRSEPIVGLEAAALLRALQDRVSENQACGLAAEASLVAVGRDDVVEDLAELGDLDVLLGDRDEVELIGEQPADQCGADAEHVLGRGKRFAGREVQELMDLCAQHRDRRVGVLGKPRPLVRELALLDEQDGGLDLLGRQVARRALERELVQGLVGLAGELRLGPVRVEIRGEATSLRAIAICSSRVSRSMSPRRCMSSSSLRQTRSARSGRLPRRSSNVCRQSAKRHRPSGPGCLPSSGIVARP